MPDASWWIIHGITFIGLVAGLALAFAASRRVGARTPYGELLLVFALGFWLLLMGFLNFRGHELLMGSLAPSGNVGDAFSLGGWVLLTSAFYLFTLRFPRRGASTPIRRGVVPLALGLPLGLLMVLLYARVLNPDASARDLGHVVQASYLFVDGVAMGVLAAGVERLYRFRASAIGRLHLLLGAALAAGASADVAWNWGYHRGGDLILAHVGYATASGLALVALAVHYVEITRRDVAPDGLRDPTLRLEQRVLRDLARQLKGLVGDYGAGLALAHATRALTERGVPHRVVGDIVEADAPADVWRLVLHRVRDGVVIGIGDGARASLASVAAAYGDAFGFLQEEVPT